MGKVALLIGVSKYEPGLNPLPGSVKDVDAVQKVLLHPEIGGFAERDVTVLKNPQRQEMENAIYNLFADRNKEDLLLFYFSGHGIKDENGKLYLSTRNTCKKNDKLVKPSAVSASFLHESMNESRSQHQVIILDCCFSGAIALGMTVKDDGTVNIQEQLGGKGRAILTSSSSTQYSFAQKNYELSLYTYYLVEGLKNGAADFDDDGWISVDELHKYVSSQVREIAPKMTPKFYPVEEGYEIFLARAPKPYGKRLEYLRKYLEALSIAAEQQQSLSDKTLKELEELQKKLGLRDEIVRTLEQEVTAFINLETTTGRIDFKKYLQSTSEPVFTFQVPIPIQSHFIEKIRDGLKACYPQWVERIFAVIAVFNLGLCLFDLSYIPWRDFLLGGRVQLFVKIGTLELQFPQYPVKILPFNITPIYDIVKGIEEQRDTKQYLQQVENLNQQINQIALQIPETNGSSISKKAEIIDAILVDLRDRSKEIIETNPFQIANKTGTLEKIKNRMRQHIFGNKEDSAKEAFEIFWSRKHLTQKGFREELNFFAREIKPLLETNYFRPIGENGELVDNFGLIDFPFFIIFGLEFLARTWYISRRRTRVSGLDILLWRWYDIFLLIPVWRWLRIIPVGIRLYQAGLIRKPPSFIAKIIAIIARKLF